ncbi:LicD family protein [Ligilactobacillus agilis]|uniref:LicD family protein n=1 Tax=Ligilactobacillus agilis TaxID=1601 RepID=UPI00067F1EF4|nr:LicD family protein [Ligilactobacillus agilis]
MKRDISIEESQKMVFEILKFYKDICDDNNLTYYLAYGTLIGAVRHGEFIPWDDDIDVFMPREDYNKLVEIMDTIDDRYKLVSFENNKRFTAPLPKIIDTKTKLVQHYDFYERVELGLYIDIFIIDNAGNTYEEATNFYENVYSIYKKWFKADLKIFLSNKSKLRSILGAVKRLPYKIRGISYYLRKYTQFSTTYLNKNTKYVATTNTGSPEVQRNVFLKDDFGEGVDIKFEDQVFRAPTNYQKMLEVEYGDYMKLPPKEKRVSHHKYELYFKE